MAPVLTPEDVVRRIAAECTLYRRTWAPSGFDWNRPPQSYGDMGSNSAHDCVGGGPARRNCRLCSDWPMMAWGSF